MPVLQRVRVGLPYRGGHGVLQSRSTAPKLSPTHPHYSLGWLPRWAKLASAAPKLANAGARLPLAGPAGLAAASVDHRRNIPPFAPRTFRHWFKHNVTTNAEAATGDEVILFVDSFTNYFTPKVGIATVRVLQNAGYRPTLTAKQQCCGHLDLHRPTRCRTTHPRQNHQRPRAQRHARRPHRRYRTLLYRRPSSEAAELVGGSDADTVATSTRTLAELLTERDWQPTSLAGEKVIAQPHCHHHAVMGWSPDAKLLQATGAEVSRLSGCCGLAGNFGVEKGHYDVSVAVAEQQLLPAVRQADPTTTILADGYSCRTQLDDLSERRGTHLAQLLADRLP